MTIGVAYRPIGKESIVPLFQSIRRSQAWSNGLLNIQITYREPTLCCSSRHRVAVPPPMRERGLVCRVGVASAYARRRPERVLQLPRQPTTQSVSQHCAAAAGTGWRCLPPCGGEDLSIESGWPVLSHGVVRRVRRSCLGNRRHRA